jgi:hypothetical protein
MGAPLGAQRDRGARYELGMIRLGEVFFQIVPGNSGSEPDLAAKRRWPDYLKL